MPTDPWQVREGQGGMSGCWFPGEGRLQRRRQSPGTTRRGQSASCLRSPGLLWAARPWRAPHPALEKPTSQGSIHHCPLPPDTQGWTHQGDPETPVLMGTNNVEAKQESGDYEAGHRHEQDPALDQGDRHLGQEDEDPHQPPRDLQGARRGKGRTRRAQAQRLHWGAAALYKC